MRTCREQNKILTRLAAVIAAFGLIYMGGSLAVMNHLVDESNATCTSRAASRVGLRAYLQVIDGDFTAEDQLLIDTYLPVLTC
jgi:hypothetical protein